MSTKKGYKLVPWLFGKEIEIPEEWEVKKCSKILELKHGYQFRDEDFIEGKKGIKIIKIGNLKQNGSIDSNNCSIISLDRRSDFLNIVINSGDVLMALTGATLGKIILVPKINEILLQNYRVGNFLPKNDINKNFLYYVLKNIFTQKQIWFLVNSNAQPNIGKEEFDKIKIICPIFPEQQQIATILSNVDSLIESTSKIIKNSKSLKTGLMHKLLTRGISHIKFKKVPWLFGKEIEIPEDWEIKMLDDVGNLSAGGTPSRFNLEYWNNGTIPWLSSGEIRNNIITESDEKITSLGLKESASRLFPKGTVLIAITGQGLTRGRTALLSIDASSNQSVIGIICKKDVIYNLFLWYYLQNEYWKLRSISQGSNQAGLNLNLLKTYQIILPSIHEQQKIATILSNIDAQINSQTQYKDKLERLKKSLMQKLLTGEVRVAI